MRKIKRYGWRPSLPHNVKKFQSCHPMADELPAMVDLRPKCPPVYDQGQLGSCTANGIAGAIQFNQPTFMPSRLFIYFNERTIEGDPDQDNGAQIYDGINSVSTIGVCPETEWPYDIAKFTVQPSDSCYSDALKDIIKDYSSVNNDLVAIKQVLHAGFPVVFGMTVFESFESEQTAVSGVVQMPVDGESDVGGHCMCIVGYDDSKNWFIVRNSWGAWGDQGYCFIPYDYIAKYASDMWCIE